MLQSNAINVLLLTDRLRDCAYRLKEYLKDNKDFSADVADDFADAQSIIKEKNIDFLIIVGYLKDRSNYEILKDIGDDTKVIIYESYTLYIDRLRDKYGIKYEFDKHRPTSELVLHIQSLY